MDRPIVVWDGGWVGSESLVENAGAEDAYTNDPTRPEKRINPTPEHDSYRSLSWGLGGQ